MLMQMVMFLIKIGIVILFEKNNVKNKIIIIHPETRTHLNWSKPVIMQRDQMFCEEMPLNILFTRLPQVTLYLICYACY